MIAREGVVVSDVVVVVVVEDFKSATSLQKQGEARKRREQRGCARGKPRFGKDHFVLSASFLIYNVPHVCRQHVFLEGQYKMRQNGPHSRHVNEVVSPLTPLVPPTFTFAQHPLQLALKTDHRALHASSMSLPTGIFNIASRFLGRSIRKDCLDRLPNDLLVDVVFTYLDVFDIIRMRRVRPSIPHADPPVSLSAMHRSAGSTTSSPTTPPSGSASSAAPACRFLPLPLLPNAHYPRFLGSKLNAS